MENKMDDTLRLQCSISDILDRFEPWIKNSDFSQDIQCYITALSEIQKNINLTGSSSEQDILCHIQESMEMFFLLNDHYRQEAVNLLDIGSGGGFPAIPLACARSSWRIILTESTQKKAIFLDWIKQGLNLTNAFVHAGRVEDWIEKKPSYRCDILTAKGVGKTPYLLNLARALLKPKGLLILWKNIGEVNDSLKSNADFMLDKLHTTALGKTVLSLRYSGKKVRVR